MRGSFLYAVITGLVFLGMTGPASARDGQSDYYGALGAKSEGRSQDAFGLYDRACSGGYLAGCIGAAGMLADGDGIAKDQARARQYFQTACNGQHKVACNWLGDMLLAGEGGVVDEAGARALYARGCSLDHAASCVEGGELIEFGKGGPKSVPDALNAYRKGCESGDPRGCNLAGVVLESDAGGADMAAARGYFEQACQGAYYNGCANFGKYLQNGTGGPKDAVRAREVYRMGCGRIITNLSSCYRLGAILLTQEGGPRELFKGADALEKVCTSQQPGHRTFKANACYTLGAMFENEFSDADPALAVDFYAMACAYGHTGERCGG
tara:strand:- start:338 stop:1312 length:975 start_codon:yes stop_codon:yes gene_type:complete